MEEKDNAGVAVDNTTKVIRTVVGEAEEMEGLFLCCIDSPKIGASDIQLIGLKIEAEELTETERKNLGIARTYSHRTKEEITEYIKGGRVCILDIEEASE